MYVNLLPLFVGFKQVGGADVEIRVLATIELKPAIVTMY